MGMNTRNTWELLRKNLVTDWETRDQNPSWVSNRTTRFLTRHSAWTGNGERNRARGHCDAYEVSRCLVNIWLYDLEVPVGLRLVLSVLRCICKMEQENVVMKYCPSLTWGQVLRPCLGSHTSLSLGQRVQSLNPAGRYYQMNGFVSIETDLSDSKTESGLIKRTATIPNKA